MKRTEAGRPFVEAITIFSVRDDYGLDQDFGCRDAEKGSDSEF